jgi:hypothetical protein
LTSSTTISSFSNAPKSVIENPHFGENENTQCKQIHSLKKKRDNILPKTRSLNTNVRNLECNGIELAWIQPPTHAYSTRTTTSFTRIIPILLPIALSFHLNVPISQFYTSHDNLYISPSQFLEKPTRHFIHYH